MKKNDLQCTFCDTKRSESAKILICGDIVICDKCILLFNGLINSKTLPNNTPTIEETTEEPKVPQLNSIEIKKFLDKHVIGQEDAKIAICVSVVNHYKRMLYDTVNLTEVDKSNLLISGPSGSGKSLLLSSVAKFLNVPFVSVDATTLTEAGYIGENVDTIISKLLSAANGDVESTERGIVFIDEIDKIAIGKGRPSSTNDNKVSGVQSALLKMVEGSIIRVPSQSNKKLIFPSLVDVNTKNILFICGGAFIGLNEIVVNRLKKKSGMGFTDGTITSKNLETQYTVDDFIEYGIIPEFIGRFPLHTHTLELSIEELIKVLTVLENNILYQYEFYFDIDDIELEFTSDFISKVASKAKLNKTGVRGLRAICDSIMTNHLFLIPEYKKRGIYKLIFDGDCVENNKAIPKFEFDSNLICEKIKKS